MKVKARYTLDGVPVRLADFLRQNRDGLEPAEVSRVNALRPGESIAFGGGAAAVAVLARVDGVPASVTRDRARLWAALDVILAEMEAPSRAEAVGLDVVCDTVTDFAIKADCHLATAADDVHGEWVDARDYLEERLVDAEREVQVLKKALDRLSKEKRGRAGGRGRP